MAWIKVIDEGDADGELKENYEKLTAPWGGVDNILKIHSVNPKSLTSHYQFYKSLMHGRSELSRTQREMIAVSVSALNHCVY